MNKQELVSLYKDQKYCPRHTEIIDEGKELPFYEGKYTSVVYAWNIYPSKNGKWAYIETDKERGYIFTLKEFNTEEETCSYVVNHFDTVFKAGYSDNSRKMMLTRFIMKRFEYSEKIAKAMTETLSRHKDIFDELFNYARTDKLCKKDGTKTVVEGYTAEDLYNNYSLSVLGAYNYLIYLREEPEEALQNLKNILQKK